MYFLHKTLQLGYLSIIFPAPESLFTVGIAHWMEPFQDGSTEGLQFLVNACSSAPDVVAPSKLPITPLNLSSPVCKMGAVIIPDSTCLV